MEARLLADEHFDVKVVHELRAKGHDVITVRSLNASKSGDGWTDEEVLNEAMRDQRILLTDNIKHFRTLAEKFHWHEGVVACAVEIDARTKAARIDSRLRDAMRQRNNQRLTGIWIDARPSAK